MAENNMQSSIISFVLWKNNIQNKMAVFSMTYKPIESGIPD